MTVHATEGLEARLFALQAFLNTHEGLWKPRPFTHLQLPWETQHPTLARWLCSQSLEDAEAASGVPVPAQAPDLLRDLAEQGLTLSQLGSLPTLELPPALHRLERDVPGRKWEQVEAFSRHLPFAHSVTHWVDWCGGKGHLGRRLMQPGQALTCLEWDPALVNAGQALSDHHHLHARHQLQNVLAADTPLQPHHVPVALHACGDLHVRLLQKAVEQGCGQLALAPCCYNRTQADHYVPLSDAGSTGLLVLSREDLALTATETVTAGARERRLRDSSMARRLGFDMLQRHVRGVDQYLPTPSLPTHWLKEHFSNYCLHLAGLKGFALPASLDWAAWEAQGWQRLAQVRNLERVRALFRRPLETWLVLDRALFLQEQGYRVQVGTFCPAALTPRNLMIVAERMR